MAVEVAEDFDLYHTTETEDPQAEPTVEQGQDANFPSLGQPEATKVKRPRLALPRAKSAHKRSADNITEESSGPSQPEAIEIDGESIPLLELGGDGDCGYRAIATMHAIARGTKDTAWFGGAAGRERAQKYGKTLRAKCGLYLTGAGQCLKD
eukprot:1942448-Alexandrium_andersonii.AAC.1